MNNELEFVSKIIVILFLIEKVIYAILNRKNNLSLLSMVIK